MLTIHITNVHYEVSILKLAFTDLKVNFLDPYVLNHRFVHSIDVTADYNHNDFTLKFFAFSTGAELRFLSDLSQYLLYHGYKQYVFLIRSYRSTVF